MTTPQEQFWRDEFGSEYIQRNKSAELLSSNVALFGKIFASLPLPSVLEVGANIGMNLTALATLYPNQHQSAVEINPEACEILRSNCPGVEVHCESLFDVQIERMFDLVLSKGVLIHLHPDKLEDVYKKMAEWSGRFVLLAEYYNPTPVMVPYRGHPDRLYKRDFAGEFLQTNDQFRLRDYGFAYRNDPQHPQDDITWFLLERSGS
jgi:pseudaminic acid biosynthesis-associated methylase